jgi:hypothetical protein
MKTFDFIIELTFKAGVILLLILAASLNHPYSFYMLVRWAVMGSSIYFLYKSYGLKEYGLVILYACLAILFNPFHKFGFQRDIWKIVDYIVAGIILLTMIYGFAKKKI